MNTTKVAVVGGGVFGLTAAKNLLEEGFEVTVFERTGAIGGVWEFTDDSNKLTVLRSTIANVSRLSAPQFCDYLKSYAAYFDLNKHIRLNTPVYSVKRSNDDTRWKVIAGNDKNVEFFDKVVFCQGRTSKYTMPVVEGIEHFNGVVRHSQAYKGPDEFVGKRVVVVGMGNTAGDVSTDLIASAKKVYLSHRGGALILPRIANGKPLDLQITWQTNCIKFILDRYIPKFARWLFDTMSQKLTNKSFKLDPAWRSNPAPSLANHQPTISDNLVDALRNDHITSLHGIRRFTEDGKIEFQDGTILEADAVIFCTGYHTNFVLMPDLDLTSNATTKWQAKGYRGPPLARLYQNMFPPKDADSIAYMSYIAATAGAAVIADLAAMAIVQIWKGASTLPSAATMNREIDEHHAWIVKFARGDTIYGGIVRPGPWYRFLNDAAGTGVNEKLGYGWQAWKFWLRDRSFAQLLITGVMTPYMFRLFDGKRKKWDGAREAILRSNDRAKLLKA